MRAVWIIIPACVSTGKTIGVGDEVGSADVQPDTDVVVQPIDTAARVDTEVPADSGDTGDSALAGDTDDLVGTRLVRIMLTADDAWTLHVDGVPYTAPNATGWSHHDELEIELYGADHVLAVHAFDQANVISGFIAVVWVSHGLYAVTGEGKWRMVGEAPAADWTDLGFDDSAWVPDEPCAEVEQQVWGTYWPADFYALDAEWVWTRSCRDLGAGWFRLVIE